MIDSPQPISPTPHCIPLAHSLRGILQRCVFVCIVGSLSAARIYATPIDYNLVDYPAFQNGWTLSGHIKTDGTLGLIKRNNILEWSGTIRKGASSITINSTTDQAYLSGTHQFILSASPSQLSLTNGTNLLMFGGVIFELGSGQASYLIFWDDEPVSTYIAEKIHFIGEDQIQDYFWQSQGPVPGAGSAIAATVPKPSTLALAVLGALGLLIAARRKL